MAKRKTNPAPKVVETPQLCPTCGGAITPQRAELATGGIQGAPVFTVAPKPAPADPTPEETKAAKGRVKLGTTVAQDWAAGRETAKRDARDLLHTELAEGTIAVRDDADGDGRTIEGIAVPYGQPTRRGATREFGNRREAFRAGAFARIVAERGDRNLPVVDSHGPNARVIGGVRLTDTPAGLAYSGRLLSNSAAGDFAEAARAGLVTPSIEFVPGRYSERADIVEHSDVELLAALAFTHRPAYQGTTVSVREVQSMHTCEHCGVELVPGVQHECAASRAAANPVVVAGGGVRLDITREALEDLVTQAADEAIRRQMEGGALLAGRAADPSIFDQYQSFGHLVYAAAQEGASLELRSYAARALADVVSTSGANAGMMTANTFGEVRRLVDLGRPSVTAFGGPAPLLGVGDTFGFPYYDGTLTDLVAAQSAQKAEIESAVVDIKRASVTIATYAGGADIAYQLIRRSEPSYLEAWGRIMLAAWGVVTNAAFVTALEAGSVTGDFAEALASVDATELKNLFVDASVAVQLATGTPAEFVLAGTNAFKAAAKLMTPAPVFNAAGTASARTLEVNVSGLPVIHEPSMTTAKFVASNRQAARWHEDGPFQASADDVAKLGRNVAYWSLGAPAIYVPAGVIEIYDVTP